MYTSAVLTGVESCAHTFSIQQCRVLPRALRAGIHITKARRQIYTKTSWGLECENAMLDQERVNQILELKIT